MEQFRFEVKGHPLWWAFGLFATGIGLILLCSALFAGFGRGYVPVTLTSERAGLVMETGSKVKLRGVEVGRVAGITGGQQPVALTLEMFPDQIDTIPSNVDARIEATTAFGAKFVDLVYPENPSPTRLTKGAVLKASNVGVEVNTVFDNVMKLLDKIDVAKLNGVLTALADGVRGQGDQMGEATTAANQVLSAINPKMETLKADWRSFKGFSDAYSPAAQDILSILNSATTTSATISRQAKDLDSLLLSSIGFGNAGVNLLGPNRDAIIDGINVLEPTFSLLHKYNPSLTCTLVGAKWDLDNGIYQYIGGNGRSAVQDVGLLAGDDLYRFPDNLPKVAAKGGPGGQPGCGSLPDASKAFPVKYLVTDTGYGDGMDIRPNPGIGFPGWANYLPVTQANPQPPGIFWPGGPAPGPDPAVPGGAPYGAPLYGPDGLPLWPGVPPAPATPPSP